MENEKNIILSQEDVMKILDTCYDRSVQGIPHISPAVEQIANEYMAKYPTTEKACKAMIKNQIIKCTTSGFITGFGWVIALPVTLPYKFYESRILLGIVYLCSGGIFGIGVIVDLIILLFKPNPYYP